MIVLFNGCANVNEEGNENASLLGPSDFMIFSSVEELLSSYRDVVMGEADEEFIAIAEQFDFAGIETIYLPIGIPDEYVLRRIEVSEGGFFFTYVHEEDMISEEAAWKAINENRHFMLVTINYDRTNFDASIGPMDGVLRQNNITAADLIDGKYFFREPNRFHWAIDRTHFRLDTPIPSENYEQLGIDSSIFNSSFPWRSSEIRGNSVSSRSGSSPTAPEVIDELLEFTELGIINLNVHMADYMFIHDFTTIIPNLTFDEVSRTLMLNAVRFSAVGKLPEDVFIEVNKLDESGNSGHISSQTVQLDRLGVAIYDLGESPISITNGIQIEILVYTDSTREVLVNQLLVTPIRFS